jgi:hypothetical protein
MKQQHPMIGSGAANGHAVVVFEKDPGLKHSRVFSGRCLAASMSRSLNCFFCISVSGVSKGVSFPETVFSFSAVMGSWCHLNRRFHLRFQLRQWLTVIFLSHV